MNSLQRLHTRDLTIHGQLAELESLRKAHKEKCTHKACKRCATFRRQLDSLTKEKALIAELLRSYVAAQLQVGEAILEKGAKGQ